MSTRVGVSPSENRAALNEMDKNRTAERIGDAASLMTSSGIGTDSQTQNLPNSPEALQTDVSEQRPHPPSRRLRARKKAIKDGMEYRGSSRQLLSGWKEIANHMHQGVRTVQRWEGIGLPVRRIRGKKPSHVIAFAEDLDFWARSSHVPWHDRIEELTARVSSLEAQIRSLKRQLRARTGSVHKTPTSHANTQLFQNDASASPPRSHSNNGSRPTLNDTYGSVA